MSAKIVSVMLGQSMSTQQSHGLIATARLLVVVAMVKLHLRKLANKWHKSHGSAEQLL